MTYAKGKVKGRMQLKARLTTMVCTAALVAGAGVVFAGPALAIDHKAMCFQPGGFAEQCAENNSPVKMGGLANRGAWNAPTSPGQVGQISVYNSSPGKCMWVDHGVNSNEIVLKACDGYADPQDEWITEQDGNGFTYVNYKYTNLCLNDRASIMELNASTCNGSANQVALFIAPIS